MEAASDFVINTFRLTLLIHSNIELRDNTIIVVLGASGDLAKKKTVGAGKSPLMESISD